MLGIMSSSEGVFIYVRWMDVTHRWVRVSKIFDDKHRPGNVSGLSMLLHTLVYMEPTRSFTPAILAFVRSVGIVLESLRREVHEELRAEAQGVCTVREQSGRRSLTPAEILQIKLKSDQNMYRRFWKDFERDSPIPPLPYHYQGKSSTSRGRRAGTPGRRGRAATPGRRGRAATPGRRGATPTRSPVASTPGLKQHGGSKSDEIPYPKRGPKPDASPVAKRVTRSQTRAAAAAAAATTSAKGGNGMGGTKKTTTASGTANSGKSSQKAGGTSMKSAKRKPQKGSKKTNGKSSNGPSHSNRKAGK
ncbi:hypothetical protein PRIPAC_97220 [Pristionchus pacificus]|uniref:Uncharacterized protein n=1 Tax=Pristionchus pacificus TaxID=54126 RepID=A0A2A6BDE4_PRIPA|nr:hypothetical protein PRIPAC_97220 [Pristionchus pacificus]|eukprot:PDM63866.1 hypothetical protein PRIPAC_49839 [Pristionchus pacificus]